MCTLKSPRTKQHVGWGRRGVAFSNVREGARREEGGFRGGEETREGGQVSQEDVGWKVVAIAVAVRVGVVSVNGVGLAWVSPVVKPSKSPRTSGLTWDV